MENDEHERLLPNGSRRDPPPSFINRIQYLVWRLLRGDNTATGTPGHTGVTVPSPPSIEDPQEGPSDNAGPTNEHPTPVDDTTLDPANVNLKNGNNNIATPGILLVSESVSVDRVERDTVNGQRVLTIEDASNRVAYGWSFEEKWKALVVVAGWQAVMHFNEAGLSTPARWSL
jgi:hypothetical protein